MQNVVTSIFTPWGLQHERILKVILQYKCLRKNNTHIVVRELCVGKKFVFARNIITVP